MRETLLFLAIMAPAMLCIGGAIYLAARDKDGWGWLVFAALLVSPSANAIRALL